MKKTIILSTIILLSVMIIGCSENSSITGPDKQINDSGMKLKPGSSSYELIWEVAELSVDVNDGYPLEKSEWFTVDPISSSTRYFITFTGYTDADKWTNGYLPLVEISNDNNVVLSLNDKESISNRTQVQLEKATLNDVEFHIALFTGDKPGKPVNNSCVLKLTNLRIYIIH